MSLHHLRERSRSFIKFAFLFSGFAVLLGFSDAFAQTTAISGAIQDTQKAQIAGAKITAVNTGSGDRHDTVSNGEGFYVFPVVLPGHYDLTVEKQGFDPQ